MINELDVSLLDADVSGHGTVGAHAGDFYDPRRCLECGTRFEYLTSYPTWSNMRRRVYCSQACCYTRQARRAKDARQMRREISRRHTCKTCGAAFEARADSRYCGSPCRQRAYRLRVTSKVRAKSPHPSPVTPAVTDDVTAKRRHPLSVTGGAARRLIGSNSITLEAA